LPFQAHLLQPCLDDLLALGDLGLLWAEPHQLIGVAAPRRSLPAVPLRVLDALLKPV
jgi:hypothetical protein